MGMYIDVVSKTWNTVHLTDEDVQKVREWINKKKDEDDLPYFDMEKNICSAVFDLYQNGEISLYDDSKCVESDCNTENVEWSEFEDKGAEEILGDEV